MTEFVPKPPRLAASIASIAAVVAVALTVFGGGTAVGVATLGLPVLAVGALRGRRLLVSLGGLLVVVGAIVGGTLGAPAPAVLAAVAAGFVAWDVAEYGIDLGDQVGSVARSRNVVLTHAASTTLVAALTTMVGIAIYTTSPSGRPLTALLLLLSGAVVIAIALTD